jgi:hypothetical protein
MSKFESACQLNAKERMMSTTSLYHTFDICQDIADKLRDPLAICEAVQATVRDGHFTSSEWAELALAEGLPGIAAFYGVIDQLFPDQGWDQMSHTYLKAIVEKIEHQGIDQHALFTGLPGICFAISLCSHQGLRYQQLLATMEKTLIARVDYTLLPQIDQLLDKNQTLSPSFYNLFYGLNGILAYLLIRKEDPSCHRLALQCLHSLICLLRRSLVVKEFSIPGWYVSQEEQLTPEEKTKYPNGSFILGISYGVTGCLSILSLAILEGVIVPGQYEIVQEVAQWLKSKQNLQDSLPCWPHTLSFEEEVWKQKQPIEAPKDTWNYGTPTVARSLYLAAKATRDRVLMQYAENAFLSVFQKAWQEWNLVGPSFFWGRAGLLALTYHMAQDTGHPLLLKQVDHLEQDLKRFYHVSHPFGFQTVHISETSQYSWVNHPGLVNGSVGVVLALLLSHFKQDISWSRIFLIN